jgi:hypothetical protein
VAVSGREIEPPVPWIGGIPHVGVIDQNLLSVSKIDAGAVGIAERMKSQFGRHIDDLQ